ncbi:hypothetical protein SERLA73DRAFT_179548, partial [Serpula lacrymans var. lacrymans S7.3]
MHIRYSSNELKNPHTPLAYLSLDVANQVEVARYLYAVTLGAYVWDIATNLDNNYKLLVHHRVGFPTIAYWLSRVFTLSWILTMLIFQAGFIPNCQALQIAMGVCLVLAQSATSLLFLLQTVAIWHGNHQTCAMFIVLWVAVVGSSLSVPISTVPGNIGPTQQCIVHKVYGYAELFSAVAMLNDSVIPFAISYRILTRCTLEKSFKSQIGAFLDQGSIPKLSCSSARWSTILRHSGFGNILLLVLLVISSVP